ncbi:MAG: NTF2 fold immunity protein [Eubacteriales bacterium]
MKKKRFFVIALFISLLFSSCSAQDTEDIEEVPVYEKCIHEIQENKYYYIDNDYSTIELLGKEVYFDNSADMQSVVLQAEQIWFEIYGEEYITAERPYKVMYDFENDNWYIEGTLHGAIGDEEENVEVVGGVASIVVSKDTGQVLKVWHSE